MNFFFCNSILSKVVEGGVDYISPEYSDPSLLTYMDLVAEQRWRMLQKACDKVCEIVDVPVSQF